MLFPDSPKLPGPGDRVIIQGHGNIYNPQPFTVALLSPDKQWVSLVETHEPARIETINWWPQVGDRVELLFCPYLNWLEAVLKECGEQRHTDPADYEAKMTRVKKRIRAGLNYRTGLLISVDDRWANVQFSPATEDSPATEEVIPFCCIGVLGRP